MERYSMHDLKIQVLSPRLWIVTLPGRPGVVGTGTTTMKAVRAFKKQEYFASVYATDRR